jgi:hypothetical protein
MGVPLLNYVPTSSCWKILRATESANDGASHHTHYYDSSVCVNLQYFLLKCAKARFVVVVTVYSHHFTTEQGWRNLGSSIARHASMLVQNLLIEQIADNCCNKYLAIFLSTYHIPKTVLLLFHTITWDLYGTEGVMCVTQEQVVNITHAHSWWDILGLERERENATPLYAASLERGSQNVTLPSCAILFCRIARIRGMTLRSMVWRGNL